MIRPDEIRKKPLIWQLSVCLLLIGLPAVTCAFFTDVIGYQVVALILLLVVSLIAGIFDRWPVFISAALSALIWDFFFIPPRFTITVSSQEDLFLLLLYFVIALLNVVITSKIREIEKKKNEKEEQERTIRLYNTLLQTLSHELRTPVTTIIGAVDTLEELDDRLNADQKKELTSSIQLSALRLNDQVEKLLCMSRIEAGAVPFQPAWCDVNELIYDTIARNADLLQGYNVVFLPGEDLPLFYLDPGLIETAVFNLVQNACRYSPAGKTITIRTTFDSALAIVVEDEGPGIPLESREAVLGKFVRLSQVKTGGVGLGLAIVKGLAEAHGGTVAISAASGGGAQVAIRIPAESSYINVLKHE